VRYQKIRGHRKRFLKIEKWRQENLEIRWDLIEKYNYHYTDIVVHPWCDISILNSLIPEPKRKAKHLILLGLLDIYDSWKKQLDKLEQPYYLKIWLFEPRFSKSQVVCATGERIEFYENNFFKPDKVKKINPEYYGQLKNRLEKINWEYRLDEDHYDNCEVGEPESYVSQEDYDFTKKWFKELLKKPHRTTKFIEPIGDTIESYSFKRGDIWIGGQK